MLEENKTKRFVRNMISGFLAVLLILSGKARKARRLCFHPDTILSIFFHNPPRSLFYKCIRWLSKNGFTFVSTADIYDFLYNDKLLPVGAVWVTFDDGWKDNLTEVVPVMEQFKVPDRGIVQV